MALIRKKIKYTKNKLYNSPLDALENLIGKRQRLVVAVVILSILLFVSEHFLGKSGIFIIIALSILTDIFLYISLRSDLKENFSWNIFILPFFFSLAFGLFYLIVPARMLTRIIMTTLYAVGLYSLFLSQNIFTVSSIRTIALVSGARTVSFSLTLLAYSFLSNVIFTFHFNIFLTLVLVFAYTFPLVMQSLWVYTLEKSIKTNIFWVFFISFCLLQVTLLLWFWPSTPTIIALFLSGIFYTLIGLTHVWFEKRLFRSVILEYAWVTFIAFAALVLFTPWN